MTKALAGVTAVTPVCCPVCDGTGDDLSRDGRCVVCDGTGELPYEEAVELFTEVT